MKIVELVKEKSMTVGVTGVSVLAAATPAFAEGTANAAVTGAFTGLASDIVSTIGVVAVAAIGVAAVFLGFKYGRKILNIVAK